MDFQEFIQNLLIEAAAKALIKNIVNSDAPSHLRDAINFKQVSDNDLARYQSHIAINSLQVSAEMLDDEKDLLAIFSQCDEGLRIKWILSSICVGTRQYVPA